MANISKKILKEWDMIIDLNETKINNMMKKYGKNNYNELYDNVSNIEKYHLRRWEDAIIRVKESLEKVRHKDNFINLDKNFNVNKNEDEIYDDFLELMHQLDDIATETYYDDMKFNPIKKIFNTGSDALEESLVKYVEEKVGSIELFGLARNAWYRWDTGDIDGAYEYYKKNINEVKKQVNENLRDFQKGLARYKDGTIKSFVYKRKDFKSKK